MIFRNIALMALLSFSGLIFAEPAQIDVSGIIPGVTTESQLESMKHLEPGKDPIFAKYLIGGFEFGVCMPEFHNGTLDYFYCITGEMISKDTTVEDSFAARSRSNQQIHQILVRGFTSKFGQPQSSENEVVRNGLGTEFNKNTVTWTDRKGNAFVLESMHDKIDKGRLQIISAHRLASAVRQHLEGEAKRNF